MKYVSEELIQVRNIFMNRLEFFFFPRKTYIFYPYSFLNFISWVRNKVIPPMMVIKGENMNVEATSIGN